MCINVLDSTNVNSLPQSTPFIQLDRSLRDQLRAIVLKQLIETWKKSNAYLIPFSPQTLKLKIASALNHILFKIQIEFSCFDLY